MHYFIEIIATVSAKGFSSCRSINRIEADPADRTEEGLTGVHRESRIAPMNLRQLRL